MAPTKTKDKLTDAEKKKIKQANKAKANPKKAEAKAIVNQERRYKRRQDLRPEDILAQEESKRQEKERNEYKVLAKKRRDDAEAAKLSEAVNLKTKMVENTECNNPDLTTKTS